jgi:hypothetical protein
MPTTTNRSYVTAAHGGSVDTWDGDLNTVFNQIDQNLGAVANVAVTGGPITLTAPQYVCGTIRFSGTLTTHAIVTFPSVSAWWTVENACAATSSWGVQLLCGGGTRIAVPPGESVDILSDGSNFRFRNLGRIGSYLDLAASALQPWIVLCTVPPYLVCDGSSFSAVTYPILANLLGGTTLPDARGRSRFALNGGTGRLTATGGINGDALLAAGGDGDGLIIGQANLPNVTLNTAIAAGQGSHFHGPGNGSPFLLGAANGVNLDFQPPGSIGSGTFIGATAAATLPAMSGTTPLGGSGTALASVPPGYVGGITLIRAG